LVGSQERLCSMELVVFSLSLLCLWMRQLIQNEQLYLSQFLEVRNNKMPTVTSLLLSKMDYCIYDLGLITLFSIAPYLRRLFTVLALWTKRHWGKFSSSIQVSPGNSLSINCFIFINHLIINATQSRH
jgi:hypothetical protein